jgi:multidrug efflux system membrane fusion protein
VVRWGLSGPSRASEATEATSGYPPVKVALAPVVRSDAVRYLSGVGELQAARQVQVMAEAGGRVTKIAFESGQAVKAGALLVQLNDAPEQAELIRLRAQLRNAETLYARARSLVAQRAAPQEQLDNALADRDMALGAVRHTQALAAQKAIVAPFDGVIGIRKVHPGQYLNAADLVASLVDARVLHVNFALDEQSSPGVQIGQSVRVRVDAYPNRSVTARVSAVDPLISRARTVQVQATLDNPDGLLKAGMYASVQVVRDETVSVLSVPETAVTYTAYGETVFVAQRNAQQQRVVKQVAVTVGERRDGRVEITTGLQEDDAVVTSGQLKLSDGMVVSPAAHDTLAAPADVPPRTAAEESP